VRLVRDFLLEPVAPPRRSAPHFPAALATGGAGQGAAG